MIYITGDTHSEYLMRLSHKNFPEGKALGEDDYIIIAGDFGGLWDNSREETYGLKWLLDKKFTVLFIDGNHENFDMLDALPEVDMFCGKVGKVQDRLFHLKRGYIYTIDGVNIFTFGGGLSVDKKWRTEGVSWWTREYASPEELNRAWKNINSGKHIDYVVTHVPPQHIIAHYFENALKIFDITALHLRDMSDQLFPRIIKWYFGHMHVDEQLTEKYIALYEKIIPLGADLPLNPDQENHG